MTAFSLWLLLAYLGCVFLLGERFLDREISAMLLVVLTLFAGGLLFYALISARRHQWLSRDHLGNITAATVATLLALLAADTLYSMYLNATAPTWAESVRARRTSEPYFWIGEVAPRQFYPTERNFTLHKPGLQITNTLYGPTYYPRILEAPEVARLVLELKTVSVSIDEVGLRNTTPIAETEIFALGDSFTYGAAVDQAYIWSEVLGRLLATPVYNLGVGGSSPRQQLLLLEHILTEYPEARPRHVLWMLFEGNDLEGNYRTQREASSEEGRGLLDGTAARSLLRLPYDIRNQSMIRRILGGTVTLSRYATESSSDPYVREAARLGLPLFHSNRHGYRLFWPSELEVVGKPESYVSEHPNLPRLAAVFDEMSALSQQYGFEVSVVVAPTSPRLYGSSFEDLPTVSDQPYFAERSLEMAREHGFRTIDLIGLLRPHANESLLYYRDDPHWNIHGNQVVARVLAEHLFGLEGQDRLDPSASAGG